MTDTATIATTATASPAIRPSELPQHIEGAIFDLDGTLLDSMPYWDDLGERYLRARGKTPNPDVRKYFKTLTMEGSAIYMKETYGLTESIQEIFDGVMDGIRDAYRDEIPLKPGVAEMLELFAQQGVHMCVATASERDCVDNALNRLGIMKYFSAIYTCTETGLDKNSPAIFNMALEHLGTKRERTWVFEDSLHAIEAAKQGDFPIIAINEPASAPEQEQIRSLSHVYVNSFTELFEK